MNHQYQTLRQKKLALQNFTTQNSFRFGLLGLTVLLLICHVIKMSSVATQGYQITHLQQEIEQLQQEKQKVDIEIARLSSMNYIQEKVSQMQFVPIEKPEFMTVHGSSVAKR